MYPTLCKVRLAYELDGKTHREEKVIIMQAKTYAEAIKQIEEYYGGELDGVDMVQFTPNMLEFPAKDYDYFYQTFSKYM